MQSRAGKGGFSVRRVIKMFWPTRRKLKITVLAGAGLVAFCWSLSSILKCRDPDCTMCHPDGDDEIRRDRYADDPAPRRPSGGRTVTVLVQPDSAAARGDKVPVCASRAPISAFQAGRTPAA